jgi:hypothetical protein
MLQFSTSLEVLPMKSINLDRPLTYQVFLRDANETLVEQKVDGTLSKWQVCGGAYLLVPHASNTHCFSKQQLLGGSHTS